MTGLNIPKAHADLCMSRIGAARWNGPSAAIRSIAPMIAVYLVYYYSYDDVTGPFGYYSIEVVGIFKSGTDCDDCDKEEILAKFYEKLFMWKASQSPGDFKDSLIDPQSGLDTCIQPLWTKGECLDGQMQGCDPDLSIFQIFQPDYIIIISLLIIEQLILVR